jgi:hypothetical protein
MAVSELKFIVLLTVTNGGLRRSEYVVPGLQPPCEQQINWKNLTGCTEADVPDIPSEGMYQT